MQKCKFYINSEASANGRGFCLQRLKELKSGYDYQMCRAPMQLVTPRVVMMAVRMLMMSWMMNFHVSLVIVVTGYSFFRTRINTNIHESFFLGTNASEDATNQHECAWWQAAEPSDRFLLIGYRL